MAGSRAASTRPSAKAITQDSRFIAIDTPLGKDKLEGIRKGVVHTESPPWLCGWHTYLPSFSEQIFKSAAQVGTPLPHRHPLFG